MSNFELKSYAKVNLLLKIIGKNKEDYHELQMLTALSSTYDTLSFKENNEDSDRIIEVKLGEYVREFEFDKENNSIIHALKLARTKFSLPKFFDIEIEKNIPAGSGLGGGSSNAAYILIHFAKMFNESPSKIYNQSEIKAISSDIFCFINEHSLIFQSGIGDKVSKVNFIGDKVSVDALLFFPEKGFSTLSMYKNFSNYNSYSKTQDAIKEINFDNLQNVIGNDFLKVVKELYPTEFEFYTELTKLNQGKVSMSGSGSTFFLIPNSLKPNMEAINELSQKYRISYINTKILLK